MLLRYSWGTRRKCEDARGGTRPSSERQFCSQRGPGLAGICYLMFLPAFALLLDLLLLLQLLCDAGLPQRLALASLVGLGVQSGLERRVTTHAHHHLLA